MLIFEVVASVVLVLLSLPVAVLFVQALLAIPVYKARFPVENIRPALAVLIPAHNEASGIETTLQSVLPQLVSGDRLLVVADNCSDDTALVARRVGAEVVERQDGLRRGKGYALDFGVRYLESNPPDVVIVVDADCLIEAGAIEYLAEQCWLSGRPVQALYLMKATANAGLKMQVAEFAWMVKNWVRPLGFMRIGLPCQLMGTGMAFTWSALSKVSLASGHIVEDLKLGMDLARAGLPPMFCPEAKVTSLFPPSDSGAKTQRTRWEHGHLGMIVSDAPKLFVESIFTGNKALLSMVVDMAVPPLALLTLALFSFILFFGVFAIAYEVFWPLISIVTAFTVLGMSILVAWFVYGRKIISFSRLAYTPIYALLKIPMYLKFLGARQVEWIRSKRDES